MVREILSPSLLPTVSPHLLGTHRDHATAEQVKSGDLGDNGRISCHLTVTAACIPLIATPTLLNPTIMPVQPKISLAYIQLPLFNQPHQGFIHGRKRRIPRLVIEQTPRFGDAGVGAA